MDLFKKLNDFILTITSRNENFWEQRQLGDISEKRIEKNNSLSIDNILSNSAIYGIVKQTQYFDKTIANNIQNYYVVHTNDFIYNPRISNNAPFGPISRNKLAESGVMSPLYLVFYFSKKSLSDFFEIYFKSSKWHNFMYMHGNSGARSDRFAIKDDEFFKMRVKIPHNKSEIDKIYRLNILLNNLITLYDRKLKLLSQVKKYFLDNLFAEKEYPNLRFKGFTDAWEQRKLGTITDTYSGGTPQVSVKDYYSNNEIPFIRSSDIHKNKTELYISSKGLENSSAKLVSKGHILYALYGATSGEVDISKIDGAINQAVLCINAHNDLNYFLMLFLSKNKDKIVRKYIQGGQGNLSASIIKKIKVFTTSELEETKISNLVKILSDIITLYENKQQHLTEIKKELLNTMFI